MFTRKVWFVLVGLLAAYAPSLRAETAATSTYNPTHCSTDADLKVYIRLYPAGVAYAFPYRAVTWMDGRPVEDRGPIATPDDPEGCPGNPFVTRAVTINPVSNALNGRGGTYFSDVRRPDLLRVYGNPLSGPNDFRRDGFIRVCGKDGSIQEELSDGVTVCRARMQDQPDTREWFAYYQIDFGDGSAPAHLNCRPLRLPIKNCDSSQALGDHHYMLWKLWTSAVQPLPESELKQFQMELRDWVERARFPSLDSGRLRGSFYRQE